MFHVKHPCAAATDRPGRLSPRVGLGQGGTMSRRLVVTPELMLRAYGAGLFPMAESRDDPALHWFDPEERGILPLDAFHCPRRLMRTVRAGPYEVTADREFPLVIQGCAAAAPGREGTWINGDIEALFTELHRRGHAHSVECRLGGALVGGLYGVSLGGAFFGESMFSVARDASKVALVHLVARLRLGGYRLLDTQFVTMHLSQFGAREIPRAEYHRRLDAVVRLPACWLTEIPAEALTGEFDAMQGEGGASE